MKTTLETIAAKYCGIKYNDDNYAIGGGLATHDAFGDCPYCGHEGSGHYVGCPAPRGAGKFASRRHEDAKYDEGKLTLGEATQLFKKATGLEVDSVKEIIEYAVPNMEWHHAGKLPKSYSGGMKKTYFLNTEQICKVASNWAVYVENLALSKKAEKERAEQKLSLQQRQGVFLKANATRYVRVSKEPKYHHRTAQEMNGKYGWFDSSYKSYNMPEYFSGWAFESAEKLSEFYKIATETAQEIDKQRAA